MPSEIMVQWCPETTTQTNHQKNYQTEPQDYE